MVYLFAPPPHPNLQLYTELKFGSNLHTVIKLKYE